jgi:hypothetical protein
MLEDEEKFHVKFRFLLVHFYPNSTYETCVLSKHKWRSPICYYSRHIFLDKLIFLVQGVSEICARLSRTKRRQWPYKSVYIWFVSYSWGIAFTICSHNALHEIQESVRHVSPSLLQDLPRLLDMSRWQSEHGCRTGTLSPTVRWPMDGDTMQGSVLAR